MANINVTYTENTITVDENTSNVTVAETVNTITVTEGAIVSNAQIRAAISNTSPILYNSTTGVIGIDTEAVFSNTIANSWFATKTTDELAEGSTNLYFTSARTVSAIENNYITLKGYKETVYDNGNVSGNITLDASLGSIHVATMTGNITGITLNNFVSGSSITVILKQDVIGYRELVTTTGFSNWYFVSDNTQLVLPADSINILNIVREGSNYYASLSDFVSGSIPNSQLANSNIIINGVTISLGSTGTLTTTNINEGTNLYFTAARARGNVSATSATGISYNSGTGVFSLANIPNSSLTNSAITINGTAVALGGTRTLTTTDIAEGTNLYFTSDRANSNVVSHIATVPLSVGGNLDVTGNINATGNINYQNVTDLYVTDQKITLNSNAATNANVEIISNRPEDTDTLIKWNEQSDRWTFTNDGTTYYNLATSTTDVAEGTNLYYTTDRANTAIDTRVNKAFVEGLGVSYTSLANTPTNVSFFTNDAGYLVAANLASLTANVDSVNGATGVVVLDTDDISEGSANLYFTTDRANTAIDDYVAGSENIDVTSGVISLTNALGNVNSITSSASTNLTLNSDNKLALTQNFKGRAVAPSANVEHDGYGFFKSNKTFTPVTSYTGNANIENFIFATGNTTAGSNAITGVSLVEWFNEVTPASISNVAVNSVFSLNQNNPYPFSYGARVTSVDAANSTIYMNQAAGFTQDLTKGTLYFFLQPALLDTQTGQAIRLVSQFDANVSPRSKTVLQTSDVMFPGRYGYPQSGFAISDFDVFTAGVAGDYTLGDSSTMMVGRNKLTAPTTVLTAPRGMIVGNNADLTNRAENDTISSFGVNVLWDGTDTSYVNTTSGSLTGPLTQILVKNYTDNNLQGFSTNRSFFGPRLFFTAAEGNALEPYTVTYPLNNLELGRIAFWCASQTQPSPGSGVPPAFISVVTNRDMTGSHNGGVGMYLSASPNTDAGRRGLFAAHQLGKTLIASGNATTSGASEPITFAPMWTSAAQSATGGANAVAQFNNTFGATNYQWANVNYDNASGKTGSRLSVTNGASTVAGRNGNLVIAIDRNDNGAGFGSKEWAFKLRNGQTDLVLTEDDVIRTTFAGANISTAGNITASTFIGNLSGTTATLSGNATVTGNINLGTNATINYDAVYGCFHNLANVTAVAADTVYQFEWPNVHINTNRVTVASNTQITIGQEGAYNFALELQAENTDNADRTAFIWLAKNGTDIDETCVRVSLLKEWKQVIVKEWIVNGLAANDYIEVRFAVDNISGIQLTALPAQASPYVRPAVPSAVITVTPVGV